jgi:hypothetical protein
VHRRRRVRHSPWAESSSISFAVSHGLPARWARRLRVTRSHENLILELDGRPPRSKRLEEILLHDLLEIPTTRSSWCRSRAPSRSGRRAVLRPERIYLVGAKQSSARRSRYRDPSASPDCVEEGQSVVFALREPGARRATTSRVAGMSRARFAERSDARLHKFGCTSITDFAATRGTARSTTARRRGLRADRSRALPLALCHYRAHPRLRLQRRDRPGARRQPTCLTYTGPSFCWWRRSRPRRRSSLAFRAARRAVAADRRFRSALDRRMLYAGSSAEGANAGQQRLEVARCAACRGKRQPASRRRLERQAMRVLERRAIEQACSALP